MGKVPLSQTRDSPRHRPKLGQRGEGRLWGKKLSAKPVGQRLRRVGEEGRKTKMSWVQQVPTTPCWTPALTLTARAHVLAHLSTSACLGPSTTRSGRGCEAMAAHRLLTCCLWRRQTLSQAALQVPGPIRPWRRKVCTKCEIPLPGNGGRFLGQAWEQAHRTPWTPTLLIQDLRLQTAFLLFTASHSRLWPEGGKGKPRQLRLLPPEAPSVPIPDGGS